MEQQITITPLGVLCITIGSDGTVVRFDMNRPCTAPLDSGFRRNDGGYAQHPRGLWGPMGVPWGRYRALFLTSAHPHHHRHPRVSTMTAT